MLLFLFFVSRASSSLPQTPEGLLKITRNAIVGFSLIAIVGLLLSIHQYLIAREQVVLYQQATGCVIPAPTQEIAECILYSGKLRGIYYPSNRRNTPQVSVELEDGSSREFNVSVSQEEALGLQVDRKVTVQAWNDKITVLQVNGNHLRTVSHPERQLSSAVSSSIGMFIVLLIVDTVLALGGYAAIKRLRAKRQNDLANSS